MSYYCLESRPVTTVQEDLMERLKKKKDSKIVQF